MLSDDGCIWYMQLVITQAVVPQHVLQADTVRWQHLMV